MSFFLKRMLFFIYLKLEIALAIPASNEWKIQLNSSNSNNSSTKVNIYLIDLCWFQILVHF